MVDLQLDWHRKHGAKKSKESIPKGKQARGDREAKCALWKAAVEEYIEEGLPRELMVAISNAAEREKLKLKKKPTKRPRSQ